MCLFVNMTIKDKIKYAVGLQPKTKEDIEVYVFRKIDTNTGEITSPFSQRSMKWEIGKVNKALGRKPFLYFRGEGMGKGWLHSLKNKNDVLRYIQRVIPDFDLVHDYRNGFKLRIYKAIIPKGSKHYEGWCGTLLFEQGFDGYASTKLKLVELLHEFDNATDVYLTKTIEVAE